MFSDTVERAFVLTLFPLLCCVCQPDRSVPPEPSLTQGKVEVNGVELRYATVGQGESCLWLGSAPVYSQLFPDPLARVLRCTALDSRFWVTAAPSDESFDMPAAVAEVEAARAALGMDRFVVVGHSIQALVAQEYARAHPEHVRGVIVIAYGPERPPQELVSTFWQQDASEDRKSAADAWTARFSPDSLGPATTDWVTFTRSYLGNTPRVWFNANRDPSWLEAVEGGEIDLTILGSFQASVADFNVLERRPAPTRPVFVALGRYDYLVPFSIWDAWRSQLEHLTLQVFPESGHWPHIEEPEAFAATLQAWLQRLD